MPRTPVALRREVLAQHLGRVALGVDGDEVGVERLPLLAQRVEPTLHLPDGGGADVGAVGEAEEEERGAVLQGCLGDGGAVLVHQLERRPQRHRLGPALAQVERAHAEARQRHQRPERDLEAAHQPWPP